MIEPGEEFLVFSGGGTNLMYVMRAFEAYEADVRQVRLDLDRTRNLWNG